MPIAKVESAPPVAIDVTQHDIDVGFRQPGEDDEQPQAAFHCQIDSFSYEGRRFARQTGVAAPPCLRSFDQIAGLETGSFCETVSSNDEVNERYPNTGQIQKGLNWGRYPNAVADICPSILIGQVCSNAVAPATRLTGRHADMNLWRFRRNAAPQPDGRVVTDVGSSGNTPQYGGGAWSKRQPVRRRHVRVVEEPIEFSTEQLTHRQADRTCTCPCKDIRSSGVCHANIVDGVGGGQRGQQ